MTEKTPKKHLARTLLIALGVILAAALVAGLAWCSLSLNPDARAHAALAEPEQTVFAPVGKGADASYEYGLVFYPGAKVDPQAYAPLLQALADQGWLCVVVDAPFHLTLLNTGAAGDAIAAHPAVSKWYVGGHSMGGVAASSYASKHVDELAGLVLLASFPASEFDAGNLDVVMVYGSNDTVVNKGKIQHYKEAFGKNARELLIDGGNHAQFGDYGEQKGDTPATISAEEQQRLTVEYLTQRTIA